MNSDVRAKGNYNPFVSKQNPQNNIILSFNLFLIKLYLCGYDNMSEIESG
jgi:hypothetical protein